jgi:signal peptidase II
VSSAGSPKRADAAAASAAKGHASLLATVTLPILMLDQLSKYLVSTHIQLYRSIPLLPGWLDITYTLNPGAAFSLFATTPAEFRRIFFIALSVVAIVVLAVLIKRRTTPLSSAFAFALILGGTIGNLIDRLTHGVVTDFIYFHHESFSYPVFNIADSAITIGVAVVLLFSAFAPSPGGTEAARSPLDLPNV